MNNNYLKVSVKGKNIINYLKWLIKNKINILSLDIKSHNCLYLVIDNKDYPKLKEYSKTYEIKIIKKYGKQRILNILKNNYPIFLSIVISICILYFLSNIIFSIKVISNDKELVTKIEKELSKYDIKKYHYKKSHTYLEKVKKLILDNNKDLLEWLEIENSGTKYLIKLVERKKEVKNDTYKYQSIISKKDAIITKINAYSGEKMVDTGSYVKKGDIVINGLLTKPDESIIYTKAEGKIYGEVWYKVKIEYPLYYQEEKLTGKNKTVISFYFLNHKILVFPYKKYKQYKLEANSIFENNFIPFKIAKEKLYEAIIKEEIYTFDSAKDKAIIYAKEKLKENNSNIIEINKVSILQKQNDSSKIKLLIFISAIEDITSTLDLTIHKE